MEIVFFNRQYVRIDEISISRNSRAFNYGDGFFETVKIINSQPFNFAAHFERIQFALNVLHITNNYSKTFLEEKIAYLLKVNKIVNGSVKIHVSRSAEGRYLPESNNAELFISASNGVVYKYNDPISLCFYDQQFKAPGSLSNLKSSSSLIYILASIYANQNNFDNALLSNTSGSVVEATNSNVFIVKGKLIYTPKLSDGCVDGTMRRWVLNQTDVFERTIQKNDILEADEIFITNSINGVLPVNIVEEKSLGSFNVSNSIQKKLISLNLDF